MTASTSRPRLPGPHPSQGHRGEKLRHGREAASGHDGAELIPGLDECADLKSGYFPKPSGHRRADVAPPHLVGQSLQRGFDGRALPFELRDLPLQPFKLCFAVTLPQLLLPLQTVDGKPEAVGGSPAPLRFGLYPQEVQLCQEAAGVQVRRACGLLSGELRPG